MEFLIQTLPQICQINSIDSLCENLGKEKEIQYYWLGQQPYEPVWQLQKQIHAKRVAGEISDVVLLLEHDHVYTFGKNADKNHLLDSRPQNSEIFQIDRGGEVTYHGPGQLVCYPIIDLHDYKLSVSWYMRSLEKVIISCLKQFGLESNQKSSLTGVWMNDDKICAMGVRLSRWVTMHGFALNVNPDMTYFDGMIPCGIFELGVTSLKEKGIEISVESMAEKIMQNFNHYFIKTENEV